MQHFSNAAASLIQRVRSAAAARASRPATQTAAPSKAYALPARLSPMETARMLMQ